MAFDLQQNNIVIIQILVVLMIKGAIVNIAIMTPEKFMSGEIDTTWTKRRI